MNDVHQEAGVQGSKRSGVLDGHLFWDNSGKEDTLLAPGVMC